MRYYSFPMKRIKKPRGSMLNWSHPLTSQLGMFISFIELSTGPLQNVRPIARDMVTGVISNATIATTICGKEMDLGPAVTIGTTTNDGFQFGTSATFGTLQHIAAYLKTNAPFTAAAKVMTRSTGASSRCILGQNSSAATAMWQLQMSDLGVFQLNIADSSLAATVGTYVDGNWYTVFAQLEASLVPTVYVYDRDGVLVETATAAAGNGPSAGTTMPIALGHISNNGANIFGGSVEWCGIWKCNLDVLQMAQLANDPYQILI